MPSPSTKSCLSWEVPPLSRVLRAQAEWSRASLRFRIVQRTTLHEEMNSYCVGAGSLEQVHGWLWWTVAATCLPATLDRRTLRTRPSGTPGRARFVSKPTLNNL
jgi:hypothetical protein